MEIFTFIVASVGCVFLVYFAIRISIRLLALTLLAIARLAGAKTSEVLPQISQTLAGLLADGVWFAINLIAVVASIWCWFNVA